MSDYRGLGLLVFPHVLLCVLAGSYSGHRVLLAEHARSTLDEAILLPYSPAR